MDLKNHFKSFNIALKRMVLKDIRSGTPVKDAILKNVLPEPVLCENSEQLKEAKARIAQGEKIVILLCSDVDYTQ